MLRLFKLISGAGERLAQTADGTLVRQRSVKYRHRLHVDDEEGAINTLIVQNPDEGGDVGRKPTLVLLHGYGASVGFWTANLSALSEHFSVYAIDLPLFGRSSRHAIDFENNPDVALQYYMDVLRQWKEQTLPDDERVYLAGHSFGAHLSAHYALKYPQDVDHLVLLDPWGVAARPPRPPGEQANESLRWRALRFLSTQLSPFSLVRAMPTKSMAQGAIARTRSDIMAKFEPWFPEGEAANVVAEYIYETNVQTPATGEDAFRTLSEPIAWAKLPLEHELANLHHDVDLTVLYGDRTWMNTEAGYRVVQERRQRLPHRKNRIQLISNASHHIYADNPEEFNSKVIATRY